MWGESEISLPDSTGYYKDNLLTTTNHLVPLA